MLVFLSGVLYVLYDVTTIIPGTKVSLRATIYTSYYSIGHLIRNRKAGPGWISYLRMGVFYTNFSITTP